MLAHGHPFLGVEPAGLQQHMVGDADLADVVQGRRLQQLRGESGRAAGRQGQMMGDLRHARDMLAGLVVAELPGAAQAADDLALGRFQLQAGGLQFHVGDAQGAGLMRGGGGKPAVGGGGHQRQQQQAEAADRHRGGQRPAGHPSASVPSAGISMGSTCTTRAAMPV
nr:hypothetical protein [Azospirillum oryzae]